MSPFGTPPAAPAWRRPSFCQVGECPEVAKDGDTVLVRSTLAPGVVVRYTTEEFRALSRAIQSGEFDDLA
jgi:hypothetical protein